MIMTDVMIYLAIFVIICYCLYRLDAELCGYWKRRGVAYVPATSWFSREMLDSLLLTPRMISRIYEASEGLDYVGMYQMRTPFLMVRSPEIVSRVLNKEFQSFSFTRKTECSSRRDPLSQHLLALNGERWKHVRAKLTPAFTSGKLKGMFGLVDDLVEEFLGILGGTEGRPVNVEEFCSRLSVAVMLTTSFGVDTNCANPENDKFIEVGKTAFEAGLWKLTKARVRMMCPKLFQMLGLEAYVKKHSKLCLDFISEVIEHRKSTGMYRPDFVEILMRLRDEESNSAPAEGDLSKGEALSDGMIAAQVYSFLVAGYETTTTTMSCTLFELAQDPPTAQKLRTEVEDSLAQHGHLNYDAIQGMTFLDRVIKEALRKHPPVIYMTRICTKTTCLPGTSTVLEAGTNLIIPVFALHRDPKFFPHPEEFLPQRFAGVKPANQEAPLPYLPFSDGPRKCIGMRFALLEVKVAIAKIILGFDLELGPDTKKNLTLETFARTYKIKDDVKLIFKKRNSLRSL